MHPSERQMGVLCPCCLDRSAIFHIEEEVYMPCKDCAAEGWILCKRIDVMDTER